MLLKAGALSLALLLASRLLGLLRESALAATFGASGLGDVAVLMLTLPDQSGRIQINVTRDDVGEQVYAAFKHWDLGDIIAAEG